eukprot:TRINITY_DN32944_c0_g2_i3.p1 TRINITY_DN32944_c0_g2~~TRINITY_DN32944_c0_g2_i3.p1  ORF type:complete len:693 (+),score=153.99 TRINITY_DN32944_c0_g2_i3:250-2328(+)
MLDRWNHLEFQQQKVLHATVVVFMVFMVLIQLEGCWAINEEGLALLEFRMRVDSDPFGALEDWNFNDGDPCQWTGVGCMDGEVHDLDLSDFSLGGMLAPEIGKLSNLRSLVLYKNSFFGAIPKELAELTMLEVLDLRSNKLNGTIPTEIGDMLSLKHLLICDNDFQGSMPFEIEKPNMLIELQYDENLASDSSSGINCINKKVRHWLKSQTGSSLGHVGKCYDDITGLSEPHIDEKVTYVLNPVRRKLLQKGSNLAAAPVHGAPPEELTTIPSFGSGSFPASTKSPLGTDKKELSPPAASPSMDPSATDPIAQQHHTPTLMSQEKPTDGGLGKWKYVYALPAGAFLLTIAAVVLFICRKKGGTNIGPWKTGLSGQLQKAFVTGVPKLNRAELVTACEDFSNIINTLPNCTIFKGTLSSGVEIAVASTTIASAKDWSRRAEMHFRKKVDTLSRVNHKNFVNLLGYCEEDQPFLRMLVLEYAPNGSVFEHLHVKEFEHLDWAARMRIIIGVAYCLQYMHHELNPPIPHPNLTSNNVYLTDDYAAKVAEFDFWKEFVAKGKIPDDDDSNRSELPLADTESNVYNFGVLMLEVVSGKVPHCEEQGSIVNWAAAYLNDRRTVSYMVDPSLKSYKNNELDAVCEVILQCINQDPRQRPTMKEVTAKLREVLGISPDAATPKLSPLWWAELEILSLEAS